MIKTNLEITKTWSEQSVQPVGVGQRMVCDFDETKKPNYALVTNPCPSPLFVSLSPSVDNQHADLVVPPFGQKIIARPQALNRLYIMCYDPETHSVSVASWMGEFDPSVLSQTQESVPPVLNETETYVNVKNFPTGFNVNNIPTIQRVQVENPTSFPSSMGINNFPTQFGINNFPANQNVTVSNPYKPLELKEAFTGTGSQVKTFAAPVKSLWFKNDGTTDITITVNTIVSIIKAGEVHEERYSDFTSIDITATEGYRLKVRG